MRVENPELLNTNHRIRWLVRAGDKMIPRESTMRGTWGYDAVCSCGWKTRTGGAIQSYIREEIKRHKFEVKHGFYP